MEAKTFEAYWKPREEQELKYHVHGTQRGIPGVQTNNFVRQLFILTSFCIFHMIYPDSLQENYHGHNE